MDLENLVETLRQKHRREISALHHDLFSENGTFSEAALDSTNRKLPGIGPVPSLVDRFAKLTLVADLASLAFLEQDPSLEGTVVTVSLAGHHRVMGSRVAVDAMEAAAWLRVVLGDEWAPHAYSQGPLSGGAGRPSTVYFRLFLGPDSRPCDRPTEFDGPELIPVDFDSPAAD